MLNRIMSEKNLYDNEDPVRKEEEPYTTTRTLRGRRTYADVDEEEEEAVGGSMEMNSYQQQIIDDALDIIASQSIDLTEQGLPILHTLLQNILIAIIV